MKAEDAVYNLHAVLAFFDSQCADPGSKFVAGEGKKALESLRGFCEVPPLQDDKCQEVSRTFFNLAIARRQAQVSAAVVSSSPPVPMGGGYTPPSSAVPLGGGYASNHPGSPAQTKASKPAPSTASSKGDVKEALNLCDQVLKNLDEIEEENDSDAAQDYTERTRTRVSSMRDWIVDKDHVTDKMRDRLEHDVEASGKWLHR